MKHLTLSSIMCLGSLLLALGAAPPRVMGQAPAGLPFQFAPPIAPPLPHNSEDSCASSHSVKQMEERMRNIEQELQDKLAYLQDRVAEEVEMSSPELGKIQDLSAQLEARQDELESRAEEIAAQAEAAASQIVEQEPQVLVHSSDDSGGWLGVEIGEVTPEKAKDLKLAAVRGVVVLDVEPESPAAKAGLKENDVIMQYDGQTVEGTVQFRRLVHETPAGRAITLGVSRGGAGQSLSVEMGDRSAYFEKKMKIKMRDFGEPFTHVMPNFGMQFAVPGGPEAMDWRMPVLGISAEDLSGQLGAYFGAPDNAGVLVREVRADTPAEKAGVKAGDVIIKVDGKQVRSLTELREQLRDKSDQKSVALGILRNGSEMSLPVAIEKPRPGDSAPVTHRAEER